MRFRPVVFPLSFAVLFVTTACAPKETAPKSLDGVATSTSTPVTKQDFGKTPAGEQIELYTLTNAKGMKVKIMNYGGTIVSIEVPDRDGKSADVALGFDTAEGYLGEHPNFGTLIGRYGNRIGKARFTLDGKTYKLAVNNGENHLHGGIVGYGRKVWATTIVPNAADPTIELKYTSADGEENYPGKLDIAVRYVLTADNALEIHYTATTDKKTIVNLTNHAYFNLSGEDTILDHEVQINASKFTPVDKGLIPTGQLQDVQGTPFDFRKPVKIGERIDEIKNEQIVFGLGYDHNWVLDRTGPGMFLAATVHSTKSGRIMEVRTMEPGLQFYTGNFLNGSVKGKGGKAYPKRAGFCMETQHYPDSPNKPQFPSTVLEPGQTYHTATSYRFLTDRQP